MTITLMRKGKVMVQVVNFEEKFATKSGKPYVELIWCGLRVRAARALGPGVIYQIHCRDAVFNGGEEYTGRTVEITWRKAYDMAQKFEDLFFDFLKENPVTTEVGRTIEYSTNQWIEKQKRGEMGGWMDHILPPTMM